MYEGLANVTAWFDWTALGAMGTVGALWFLALEQRRSGRAEERRKEAIIASAAAALGEPYVFIVNTNWTTSGRSKKRLQDISAAAAAALARLDVISEEEVLAAGIRAPVLTASLSLRALANAPREHGTGFTAADIVLYLERLAASFEEIEFLHRSYTQGRRRARRTLAGWIAQREHALKAIRAHAAPTAKNFTVVDAVRPPASED